jgi:sugar lactone lactonase YvrE
VKRRHRVLVRVPVALAALAVLYLLAWPAPIDPVAWVPPPAPALEGPYEVNDRLRAAERLGRGVGVGPEDVAVDAEGRIYGGFEGGWIVRLAPDGTRPEVFASTDGRPAGLRFDAAGNLLVCDCDRGLLSIDPAGQVRVLSNEAGGVPFRLTDDLDVAADGTVYFTDASSKFPVSEYVLDFLEHRPNGRLLAYDPATGETRLVLDGLYFANGVAVSPDQSFVLVVESSTYSVRRHWLSGAKQGTSETFVENLPGIPDGILSNGRDVFWLALASPRDATLDGLLPSPFMRRVVSRLPPALRPGPTSYGFVLGLDANGRVVHNLQDPTGEGYSNVTNAVEWNGSLYLGSLSENAIGRVTIGVGD